MWYEAYGFNYNPLTTNVEETIRRGFFVGFDSQVRQLQEYIGSGEMCVITGAPGTGKTALLHYMHSLYNADSITFLVDCAEDPEFNVRASIKARRSLLERVMQKDYPKKDVIIFLNELRHLEDMTGESIKINTTDRDVVKSTVATCVNLKGLKVDDTFVHRIGQKQIQLNRVSKKQVKDMLDVRFAGNNPFDASAITELSRRAKGNPRIVFELAEKTCMETLKKKITARDVRQANVKKRKRR